MTKTQRRAYPRINCEVPIVVKKTGSPPCHEAILKNYSDAGIYFQTALALEEGVRIQVKADDESILDPVTSGTWNIRWAEVRWCHRIENGPPVLYGYGVAYLSDG